MLGLGALAALAIPAFATIAWLTTTPADHGRETVLTLVAAAEAGQPSAAKALFTAEATIHMGTAGAPGAPRERIDRAFDSFAGRHRIEENSIWSIEAASLTPTRAQVDLTCRTRTATSLGTVPTQWTFEVEAQSDGSWKIVRIVWRAVAGQIPSLSLL